MKISKKIDPKGLRAEAYDPIGDQLDRITKTFAYLAEQGIDIGKEGMEQVESSIKVKAKFAKKSL